MKGPFPWKIEHLTIQDLPAVLRAPKNSAGIYAVWWLADTPLGAHYVDPVDLPLNTAQLRIMATKTIIPAIKKRITEMDSQPESVSQWFSNRFDLSVLQTDSARLNANKVSVVVCTCNRPNALISCLFSLKKLSPPPAEILVVDNAPGSRSTQNVVCGFKGVEYVREPRRGLSAARNLGILKTSGELVAFTDDDVRVHPRWAGQLQQAFRNPKVMAVTGLVLPAALDTEARIVFEKQMNGLGKGFVPRTAGPSLFDSQKKYGFRAWDVGAGANMAFRRPIFDAVGRFDERLGAGAAGCSEDSELWYRMLANGYTCRYEPAAVVYHAHRESMTELKQQMKSYLCGHTAALLVQFHKHRHWGNLRRLILQMPRYYAGLLLEGCILGFQGRHALLFSEISGFLSGISFYLKNRKG